MPKYEDFAQELTDRPDITYIPAAREDAAVGVASGAYMAGKIPVVLMQNSGLGQCLNTLTSLNLILQTPLPVNSHVAWV